MIPPQQFLTDFLKDCLEMPLQRKQLIAGYGRIMELREEWIEAKGKP